MIKKITGMCLLVAIAFQGRAGVGRPIRPLILLNNIAKMDTVPNSTTQQTKDAASTASAVPAVPKARKQPVPVSVTSITPKPIKIIQPKIIRPVIRLLH